MITFKACIVCLKTDVKVFNMNTGQLRHEYNLISGLKSRSQNGLPEYLCYQCLAYVRNFKKFRDKCQRTYYALQEILDRDKKITKSIIEELDSNVLNIEPTLSYLATNHTRTKYENVKHKNIKQNYVDLKQQENITIIQYGTTSDNLIFEVPKKKPKLWIELEEDIKQEETPVITNYENFTTEITDLDTKQNDDDFFDSHFDDDEPQTEIDSNDKIDMQGDPSMNLEEEYATILPISVKEAKAVVDVYKLLAQGKFSCKVCGKTYNSECRLKAHMRMHEMSINGTFFCILCKYYYRSELLLKSHMTEKHMYKYVCKKCPEVNFDRHSAKRHYYWGHFQEISNKGSWSRTAKVTKGGRKNKSAIRRLGTKQEIPHDFPIKSAISQDEQYALVRDRQKTKNYIDSPFKCEYCFKGFRVATTFETHLKKHDPALSGKLQCDACKICYPSTGKMYKHMTRCHIFKYSCQMCGYTCFNRGQAKVHYRWHKKVTYPCPHCKKEFSKESTKLGHIRKMHPSTNICNLCGHSFVSVTGLHIHKLKTHSKEEMEENEGKVDTSNPLYCAECGVQFRDDDAFATHLGSSNKHADTNRAITKLGLDGEGEGARLTDKGVVNMGRATSSHCDICNKYLLNDTQAVRHYDAEHPGAPYLKRYMCDICGHKTRQYANLVVHMRTHTQEKPYSCPHCDRRFSMQNNRDRHLVVHTGEKKYQCPHCNRRFSQKNTVKLHVQTVHLKIPYPPWNKKNRKRRRDLDSAPPSPAPPAYKLPLDSAHGNYLSAYIDTTNKVCGT
ncbi:zinc finger protein 569-like [Nymphalis io]|uniref:zinc finger protein 569-like n=1 Tax=Inachis io TaxID=171585 RepID=UPI002167BCF9|nr:zinc finger protein 569-like [Nymphalis io]